MNTNEKSTSGYTPDDIIVLGVASVETKGLIRGNEGVGGISMPGISEE